jgi:hypothetical protein
MITCDNDGFRGVLDDSGGIKMSTSNIPGNTSTFIGVLTKYGTSNPLKLADFGLSKFQYFNQTNEMMKEVQASCFTFLISSLWSRY